MITVRQIQRVWAENAFDKLLQQLLAPRVEGGTRLERELAGPSAAAAMAVVRLDELSQTYVPFYGELVRAVLKGQNLDGGWGDPMTTALCLRALLCGRGHGSAVERGMTYLANLQKDDGIWPNPPVKRMPADPFVSAFVLLQLGDSPAFCAAMRFDDAVTWFRNNELALDDDARRLWTYAARRCAATATQWAAVA